MNDSVGILRETGMELVAAADIETILEKPKKNRAQYSAVVFSLASL